MYFLLLLVLHRFRLQPVMKRTQAGAILLVVMNQTNVVIWAKAQMEGKAHPTT